jgi:hypothetical protein
VLLKAGSTGLLALIAVHDEPLHIPEPEEVVRRVEDTTHTWRQWADGP